MRRALPLAVLAALAAPASAFAHASLVRVQPGLRERLAAPPARIVLSYDQPVDAVRGAIVVLDAKGRNVAGPARAVKPQRQLVAALPKNLPTGAYTVRWRALSSDGHVVSGLYTFGVRVAAPPVTEAVGAQGPTTTEHVVRWLYFLALALLVGGLGFRLLVLPRELPAAAERRFWRLAGAGGVAVIEVGIVAFLLRAEDALQLPLVDFVYGDLSSLANGTRFGTAFVAMTLGYALVLALLALAWLFERRAFLWAAFAIALGFASGLSLSGHSAADAGHSWASELADWAHLGAATLWVGGLVSLFAVAWPEQPLRRAAFLRFSRLATALVGILLAAGIYLSILRFPHLHDLWRTGYGHVLLVKLALVALALAWGGAHRFLVAPRLGEGRGSRIGRSLAGESAVAMAVLLAAAVLVDSQPPPQPAPQPPAAAQARR
ncbi:MAG TPA: copper resistance protein CopC [Gaiellaceae bacterium]|nr:copper resistance protein CopC [Gaiellaceae bacterium]